MAGKLTATPKPATGPNADVVMKHIRSIKSAQGEAKDAAGAVGPLVKDAEADGVHRKAALDAIKLSRQDATKIDAYLKHFSQYIGPGFLNLTAQTDLFGAEKQISNNLTTPSDADGYEQKAKTARAQGLEAGLVGGTLDSCTYRPDSVEGEKLLIQWKEGWKAGQNQRAQSNKAPEPATKAAAAPKTARKPRGAIPSVPTDDRNGDDEGVPSFH
jgi:ribosome modulation factor